MKIWKEKCEKINKATFCWKNRDIKVNMKRMQIAKSWKAWNIDDKTNETKTSKCAVISHLQLWMKLDLNSNRFQRFIPPSSSAYRNCLCVELTICRSSLFSCFDLFLFLMLFPQFFSYLQYFLLAILQTVNLFPFQLKSRTQFKINIKAKQRKM